MPKTDDLERFRAEVRAFLDDALPQATRDTVRAGMYPSRAQMQDWHEILYRQGWITPSWPVEHGGTGWSPSQLSLFEEELEVAGAPTLDPMGTNMLGPLLITHGTEAQKKRFLEPIRSGKELWCQGYSEPGAGSDLASLRTSAVRDGDHYVVNGQKIWTTSAQYADWMFCLVRTSNEGKPQQGITLLLIDMTTPGIDVRPIRFMNGRASFNEVFLTDVRVPVENLVGEENKGWGYGKDLLQHERLGLARTGINAGLLERMKKVAATTFEGGRPLIEQDWLQREIAENEIRLLALDALKQRFLRQLESRGGLGPEVSMLKLLGSELIHHQELMFQRATGARGLAADPQWLEPGGNAETPEDVQFSLLTAQRHHHKGYTIAGGTSEVQKTIIAKRVLGM